MTTPFAFTLDCRSPDQLARFWCEALGYTVVGDFTEYPILVPADGQNGPVMFLQRVPEPKTTKNRMHLDLQAEDPAAEADRLCALGATKLTDLRRDSGFEWIVMADPEGNEFCIGRPVSTSP